MKKTQIILILALSTSIFFSCTNNSSNEKQEQTKEVTQQQRIVSLNGAITAIISKLDLQNELVGRDVTSTYPQWVKDSVKDLGHVRSLTMESIMALQPTLILASEKDINDNLKEKIIISGIKHKFFNQDFSIEGAKTLIRNVANFIGSNHVQPILNNIDASLAKIKPFKHKPKVLFIYARGAGTMMVAGRNTALESIIKIAGGQNAIQNMTDFKPLTPEALLNSNPDIILLFHSGLESLGGINGLLKIPGVAKTKAGKTKAIITMDGGLLSDFGSRIGKAALELHKLMTPYAK